jgi:hypothetical protein
MPSLRTALAAAALGCCLLGPPPLAASSQQDARELVARAINAMGGADTLRALHSVRIAGAEHSHMLEQSERPEGPYLVTYNDFDERRDFANQTLTRTSKPRSIVGPPGGFEFTTVVAEDVAAMRFGERSAPGSGDAVIEATDSLALGPERLLLTAQTAADLRLEEATRFQKVEHDVLSFTWNERRARIYLNHYTALPSAVEWVRDYPFGLWASWGDVTTKVEYSLWHLEAGGLMYPRQWTETRNGLPAADRTILELESNPEPSAAFEITAALRGGFDARKASAADQAVLGTDFGGTTHEAEELAPGILQVQGMWNVALVDLPEGIVVIEAPISSNYSAQVITAVAERFPGREIVGVISTSDAWPHHGGIREYVARGIPIHAFDLTIPLLERVAASPRTFRPDLQSRQGAAGRFVAIDTGTTVGTGDNRMQVVPIRGEGGERMLAVYFPAHRLLYASDLLQRGQAGAGFFMPSYVAEVEALVEREGFEVDTVFAMHLGPTPWSEVVETLRAIRAAELGSVTG